MTLDLLYSVEREFAHPIEGMWHAWTDAASLEEWYRPLELSVVPGSVTSEVEVAGWWTVAVDVPDEGFVAYFFGRYTRLEPMTAIEHTMHVTRPARVTASSSTSRIAAQRPGCGSHNSANCPRASRIARRRAWRATSIPSVNSWTSDMLIGRKVLR